MPSLLGYAETRKPPAGLNGSQRILDRVLGEAMGEIMTLSGKLAPRGKKAQLMDL